MGGDDLWTATYPIGIGPIIRCVYTMVGVAPLNKPHLLLLQVLDEVEVVPRNCHWLVISNASTQVSQTEVIDLIFTCYFNHIYYFLEL